MEVEFYDSFDMRKSAYVNLRNLIRSSFENKGHWHLHRLAEIQMSLATAHNGRFHLKCHIFVFYPFSVLDTAQSHKCTRPSRWNLDYGKCTKNVQVFQRLTVLEPSFLLVSSLAIWKRIKSNRITCFNWKRPFPTLVVVLFFCNLNEADDFKPNKTKFINKMI